MAAPALLDVLRDFGALPSFVSVNHDAQPALRQAAPLLPPQPDPAIIRAAVQEAETTLAARLNEQHAAAIAEIEARHSDELNRVRSELAQDATTAFLNRLGDAEARLTGLATSTVARILGSALSDDVARRAVAELARSIEAALKDADGVRIRIQGPASLYEQLKPSFGRYAEQVEFTEAEGLDLTVSIDDRLFETRISAWSAALLEIMG